MCRVHYPGLLCGACAHTRGHTARVHPEEASTRHGPWSLWVWPLQCQEEKSLVIFWWAGSFFLFNNRLLAPGECQGPCDDIILSYFQSWGLRGPLPPIARMTHPMSFRRKMLGGFCAFPDPCHPGPIGQHGSHPSPVSQGDQITVTSRDTAPHHGVWKPQSAQYLPS